MGQFDSPPISSQSPLTHMVYLLPFLSYLARLQKRKLVLRGIGKSWASFWLAQHSTTSQCIPRCAYGSYLRIRIVRCFASCMPTGKFLRRIGDLSLTSFGLPLLCLLLFCHCYYASISMSVTVLRRKSFRYTFIFTEITGTRETH